MESMSRSSHRRKPSTNSANVFSSTFSFKNPYGGVLLSNGGERESLQLHEYSEIFAGSSSIPVLDLSGLDEGIGPGDIRSSELDYTNIFGGLTHDEVFVPFEELLNASAKKAKTRNSAEGRPYLKECGSRYSDQSVDGFKLKESVSLHPSRKMDERPSAVISNQSFDEVSFNTTNQKNSDASDEKTHTAKMHAVSGFTHFVDESRPHKGKNDRPPLLKREVSRTWSFSAEVQPPNTKGGSSVNIKSQSSNTPITSTYPSNIKEPKQSRAFSFASKRDVSNNTAGESSDDFEDNAVDAASASALKKAVEQAQESIRLAKIIMGKKRDGYQDGSKPRPMSSVRVGDRETEVGAFGLDEISNHKKHEELDSLLAGTYRKLVPPLSNNCTCVHAETDREHGETFGGGSKLFAPDHIQSKTDENIKVKLEKNVEAAEEQGEAKTINSLLLSAEELAPNVERSETSKESIESRNIYTDGGMEKSLKDDKLCEATFVHDVSVLNSSHNKIVDEHLKSIRPEDGVSEKRENDMNGKEQQLEAVIIESCNVVTEEEMKKTSESISEWKEDGAKTDDEEINVTESHFRENKEQLKEVVNEVKLDLLPEVGEFENKVDELQINNNKQNCADDPKLPEELVQEEHVNTTTMEGGKRETFSEDEKTEDTNTLSGEDYHNGEDIDEPVKLGSNIIAETPESCHVESSSKGEDQRSKGAVDKEMMTEETFHLQDDEMLGTHYLHRSASEEIFIESKLHEARTSSVDFLDADPEENLSEDEDVSNIDIATDIHAATEIDQGDILGSHARTVELDVEQKAEGDEGSLSISSYEKIDELLEENVKETTSRKEEVREGLESEPKEINKPLEEDKADAPVEERDAKEGQQQRIEAIKRGREREKDRIAVERAIREARERAFAEVRERAAVEKASVVKPASTEEARLRAERSAVERATAEARQRALEKAKSQKISQEWGTPSERHSTRNNVLKHSFSSSDLETGVNSESAQRRKARLERHQRIKERAEKALAEKNMRDLLAQNEQAERNRLAESLDADIKRWATGKEGNLRALLSTLQYILGADSGWQSISLTEIITTAAVKKAYRKATLCVHPDKLQQRGATVHQKYICEKVFDLLKAAWNRFNSDER